MSKASVSACNFAELPVTASCLPICLPSWPSPQYLCTAVAGSALSHQHYILPLWCCTAWHTLQFPHNFTLQCGKPFCCVPLHLYPNFHLFSFLPHLEYFGFLSPLLCSLLVWLQFLRSVPDSLHIRKLERDEIKTNLFRKNFHHIIVWRRCPQYHWIKHERKFVTHSNSNLSGLHASRVKRLYLKVKIGAIINFERP
jgi:hypothetical protein